MKTLRTLLLAGASLLLLLTACIHDPVESRPTTHTILFTAGTPATRTTFIEGDGGTYPTRWTARDTAVAVAVNYGAPTPVRPVPTQDGGSAEFLYTFDLSGTSSYAFQFLSPASAVEAMSLSRESWQITIPAVQTPSYRSPDEAAQILCASTDALDRLPARQDLQFSHITAYGRITLTNLPEDAAVHAVTLSCSTPLAGSWYYAPASGTLTAREASSTLTLQTSSKEAVWFACAPGDVSGARMRVLVSTDQGTFEKTITFHSGRSFKPGRVAAFSVDFTGIRPSASGEEYVLVTDDATLAPGDKLIIVEKQGRYALGTTQKSNNRDAVSVSVSDNKIVSGADQAERITLRGSAGAWQLQVTGGYLYSIAGKNRLLTTQGSQMTGLYTWRISIAADGTATLVAYGQEGQRYLQFNASGADNHLFSCYTNATLMPVSLYRRVAAASNPYEDDPILAQSEYGAYRAANVQCYVPGECQLSRETDAGGVSFSILTPSGKSVLEFAGIPAAPLLGDSFNMTLREYEGAFVSETVFPVTVMKVDGAKVWLSDGKGNGFIVKK